MWAALERHVCLVLEVARDIIEAYPDGVWLVQLAPLSEEVLVPKAVTGSYELLSEHEKRLFGRLSVFAGRWTLEASEAVAAGEVIEEAENLDLLSGLVEKSLVVAKGSDEGVVRYRMLGPVRQYAWEKLEESGEAEEVRRRHATFFLSQAAEAEPRLRVPEDREWLESLESEHDNMRAALSWALEREEAELALRLGGAL